MLCSYFISKLYLKLTGFLFLIFPLFFIDYVSFFQIDLELFLFTVLPLATVDCSLPCCKSFLLVNSCAIKFLCGQKRQKIQKNAKKKNINTNSSVSVQ